MTPDFRPPEFARAMRRALAHLRKISLPEKVEVMVRAKLLTRDQADRAIDNWRAKQDAAHDVSPCPLDHTPNPETIAAMQSADRGEGTEYGSVEEMLGAMGIDIPKALKMTSDEIHRNSVGPAIDDTNEGRS